MSRTSLLFWAIAPDGSKEYLGPMGEPLTRHQVLTFHRPWTGSDEQADEELTRRAKLWSIKQDVLIRETGTEPAAP